MGNICGCNFANKFNGIGMSILCAVFSLYLFWAFDGAYGTEQKLEDPNLKCTSDGLTHLSKVTCSFHAVSGSIAAIGCLVAFLGSCSSSPERNGATVSSAFGLLNLAFAIHFFYYYYEKDCREEDKWNSEPCVIWFGSGIANSLGFWAGIVHALCTCRATFTRNNFLHVVAMLMYCLSEGNHKWYQFTDLGCSKDQFKSQVANQFSDFGNDIDPCVSIGFSGSFVTFAAVLCVIAAIMACCKSSGQNVMQEFVLGVSMAMVLASWTSSFWFLFSHAEWFGESACNHDDPENQNSTFCWVMGIGGVASALGTTIAVLGSILFCMGCRSTDAENDDNLGYNYVEFTGENEGYNTGRGHQVAI